MITRAIVAVLLLAPLAHAHRYVANDGSHSTAAQALEIADAGLSQAVYHVVDADSAQLWIQLTAQVGDEIYFQMGVPSLQRLADYRPVLALVGPGIDGSVPGITSPEGSGARLYSATEPVSDFHEEFTGTQSLVLFAHSIPAPMTGTFYLVAFHPEQVPGKLWLAFGQREEFSVDDLLSYPDVLHAVREFHEVDDQCLPLLPRLLLFISRSARFFVTVFGLLGLGT